MGANQESCRLLQVLYAFLGNAALDLMLEFPTHCCMKAIPELLNACSQVSLKNLGGYVIRGGHREKQKFRD
jgi:hypothetical protein